MAELEKAQRQAVAALDQAARGEPLRPLRHTLEGPFATFYQHDPPFAIQFGLNSDGTLVCTGLLVGWGQWPKGSNAALGARSLRRIRLREILDDLAPITEATAKRDRHLPNSSPVPSWLLQNVPTVHKPGTLTDDYLKEFAQLYKTAHVAAPSSPMKWLTAQLGYASEATVYRHRERAIEQGFMAPREKERRGAKIDRQQSKRRRTR
jgi:hypothetical protein